MTEWIKCLFLPPDLSFAWFSCAVFPAWSGICENCSCEVKTTDAKIKDLPKSHPAYQLTKMQNHNIGFVLQCIRYDFTILETKTACKKCAFEFPEMHGYWNGKI